MYVNPCLPWQQCGINRRYDAPGRIRTRSSANIEFSAYLNHILGHARTHSDIGSRTQNPVVREHRVGSSPTSGTVCSYGFRLRQSGMQRSPIPLRRHFGTSAC